MAETPDPWQESLAKLERRIRDAASQLRQLTQSRQLLDEKVRELERRLAVDPGQVEASRWAGERAEIRRRVAELVAELERLSRDT